MLAVLFRAGAPFMLIVTSAGFAAVQQGRPTFRSETREVVLDVVATNKDGSPVTDLTADDFEVREAGQLQRIMNFERVATPIGTRNVDLRDPGPEADVFSNDLPAADARAVVFLLADIEPRLLPVTKRLMRTFIEALTPKDNVAIVYPWRSDLSQDFTHDPARLANAINNATAALGLPPDMRSRDDIAGLRNAIASVAAGRENRRFVVFLSESAPAIWLDPILRQAIDDAKRLNVPIYTIDPRGLAAPELGMDGHLEDQTPERVASLRQGVRQSKERLQELASNTNGRSYVDAWNLERAARDLISDASSYYLLSFAPAVRTADGRFHRVNVRVKRPGVGIRARAGYMAAGPGRIGGRSSVSPVLSEALGAAVPGGELRLEGSAIPVVPMEHGWRTAVTIRASYGTEPPRTSAVRDRLMLSWIAIDSDAKVRAQGHEIVPVVLDTAGGGSPIALDRAIDIPTGTSTLRIAVSSEVFGIHGVVHMPLTIGRSPASGLDATLLMLALETEPLRTPEPPVVAGPAAGARLTTRRCVSPDDRLHAYIRVFARHPIQARIDLKKDGQVVRSYEMRINRPQAVARAFDGEAVLDLRNLPPAGYVLECVSGPGDETLSIRRAIALQIADGCGSAK